MKIDDLMTNWKALITKPLKSPIQIASFSSFFDIFILILFNSFIVYMISGFLYLFVKIFLWKYLIHDDWDLLLDHGFFLITLIPMHYFISLVFFVFLQLPLMPFSKDKMKIGQSFKQINASFCTILFVNCMSVLVSFFAHDNFQNEMKYLRLIPGMIMIYLMCYQFFLNIYCGISLARTQKANSWLGGIFAIMATIVMALMDRNYFQPIELKIWKNLRHQYSSVPISSLTNRSTRVLSLLSISPAINPDSPPSPVAASR